jgi:RHS repeat-associated protein
MQSRFGMSARQRTATTGASWRWCAALAVIIASLGLAAQSAFATIRPGIKPQWTYQQFKLNDRMTLSVNVQSGNLNLAASDIDVGGNLGPQADFSRYYNSTVLGGSDVGAGWLTNSGPDVRLVNDGAHTDTFYGPTGFQATFNVTSPPYPVAQGIGAQLSLVTGGLEVWMYRQGIKYEFTGTGPTFVLASVKDLFGNTLTEGYTGTALTSLVSQQGVTDTISEASGLITGASAPPSAAARTWGYGRDANGNLHTYTGPDGLVTTYTYDAGAGHHLIQIDDPEARRTIITYDGSDRATSVKQVTNNTTNVGDTTTFTYNGAVTVGGILYDGDTVVTDANGHATTYYWENNDGTVLRTDDPLGHVHYGAWTTNDDPKTKTDALTNQTKFKYSDTGITDCGALTNNQLYNPCKTTSPRLIDSKQTFGDPNNPFLPTVTTDGRSVVTNIAYNPFVGTVSSATMAPGNVTSYTYNANGTPATITNAKGAVETYSYNANGSVSSVLTDGVAGSGGNITTVWDSAFRLVCGDTNSDTLSLKTLDDYDRVTLNDYWGGCQSDTTHERTSRTYDKSGNMKTMISYNASNVAIANTAYTYDLKNRLTQETQTVPYSATTTYTYDGADNIKTVVNAGGTTTYNYDAADRLTSIVEPGPNTTTIGYDNADRRSSITYPNGVLESYTYDADGNVTRLTATKSTTTLLDLQYTYVTPAPANVPTDQRITVENHVSSHDPVDTTTTYSYDPHDGWLTEARTINTSTMVQTKDYKWTYDATGNRTSQQIDGGTVGNVTYDGVSDRVLTGGGSATCDDTFPHTWSRGNDQGLGNCNTWAYNKRGQVIEGVNFRDPRDEFGYSGDDNNGLITDNTVDWTNDQLGVSRKITGATSLDFLRDTNGQYLGERSGSTRFYYLTDALGSVLAVTDSTGAIVNNYTYDAWGMPITATGQTTVDIPFRFANAQWFPVAEAYHLGARFYDPRYGHFTQVDPASVYDQPGMGSRYVYADNDPVSRVDPNGLAAGGGGCAPNLTVAQCAAHMRIARRKDRAESINKPLVGALSGCVGGWMALSAATAPETAGLGAVASFAIACGGALYSTS